MPPQGIKKPTLPLHLLKELGAGGKLPPPLKLRLSTDISVDSEQGHRRGGGRGPEVSRKDRRKAERKQSRVNRSTAGRNYHDDRAPPNRSAAKPQRVEKAGGGKNAPRAGAPKPILKSRKPEPEPESEEEEEDADGFDDLDEGEDDGEDLLSDGVLDEGSEEDDEDEDGEDTEELSDAAPPQRKLPSKVKDKLAQDDAEIADLERKLGLKNRKTLPQSFKDDGLGDLLDGLGGELDEEKTDKRKRKAEADEWLAQKRRKAEALAATQKQSQPSFNESDEDAGDSDNLDEDMSDFDDDDLEGSGSEEDEDDQEGEDDFGGFDSEDEEDAEEQPQKRVRENPYVAPSTGQTAKYVPPSLRKETGSDAELANRIRRQTQGLVNRITESNLLSIIADIEKLYREYPRQHVTSSLVDLLLVQVCEPTSLPDTLLILSAGFATAAYMVLGTDFGGQLIQEVVERFDKYYAEAKVAALERPDVSKQTSNLITFISELYTFQLIGPNLIFDYIRMLLDNLSELNAELLLRIVRMCGPTLRHDDPMALKDIVTLIPPAVAKAGEKNLTVRTKFMIDTITDLKNNKMKAGAGASAVVSEHITRMKKLLGQLKSKKIKSTEPMRVGLKDIQDADKKGKWWLVGASWAGRSTNAKGTEKAADADNDGSDSDDESILLDDVEQGPDLGELAREQGMNTGVRRSIFVSIMSAMDYQDAYFRILKLRLNKERQREVPNVIIRCVGAAQHYHPYYTLIAKRLCSEQREVRWAFQASLWKLFGRMGETGFGEDEVEDEEEDEAIDLRRIVNTAKMFGALVAGSNLGVIVLKRLNLLYLQKKTRDFVEVMLVNVLLECQGSERPEEAIAKVFAGVEAAPDLARGLQYFLKKVVRKSDLAGGKKNAKLLKEGCKMAEAVVQTALARGEGLV
jgi:nucleolar MIF4G domain-containing protein 1